MGLDNSSIENKIKVLVEKNDALISRQNDLIENLYCAQETIAELKAKLSEMERCDFELKQIVTVPDLLSLETIDAVHKWKNTCVAIEVNKKIAEMEKQTPKAYLYTDERMHAHDENAEFVWKVFNAPMPKLISEAILEIPLYALPVLPVPQHKKITNIELAESEIGSWETYLPKITQEIYDRIGEENNLIETLPDGSWNWTQDAVDFACIIPVTKPVPQQDYKAQRDLLLKEMRKLACLGNGDKYGNSDGNCIAIKAIAQCEATTNN